MRASSLLLALLAAACARPPMPAAGPRSPTVPRVASAVTTIRSASRVPSTGALVTASPTAVGMDRSLTARLDSVMAGGLNDGVAPGGVLAVGRHGRVVHLKGYGFTDWGAGGTPTSPSTIYDV